MFNHCLEEEESCLATKKLVDNSGIKNMRRRIWYGIGLFKHLAQSGAEVLRSLLEGWGCPLPRLSIASWGTPSHGPGDTGMVGWYRDQDTQQEKISSCQMEPDLACPPPRLYQKARHRDRSRA
ncbi:hypothetical protein NDU88_008432 [Pleurodeles waltl]|uniref:Uncharacterized protein n=1 Tax=Pleurodeles waltl TaxID=8319 RepID=A0AAV7PRK8_PLEWA|nr:hypothetical protein NDU88_008432 [Pleurodeles waltl]